MRPLKEPPPLRRNWNRLNEGQRRYAMEQYNLARVRRGVRFEAPGETNNSVSSAGVNAPQEHEEHPSFEEALAEGEQGDLDDVHDIDEDLFEEHNDMADSTGGTSMQVEPSTSTSGKGRKRPRKEGTDRMRSDPGQFRLPGTARGQGGNETHAGNAETIQGVTLGRPYTYINSYVRYYRKLHRFFTYGISFQMMLDDQGVDRKTYCISTPYANVPWECLFMYITEGEYSTLPRGAWVDKMRVKVVPRNVRIAFPTNSTGTELATLNQNKNMLYGMGLNKKMDCQPISYTSFVANKPMVPNGFTYWQLSDHENLRDTLYGSGTSVDFTAPIIPRHQMGIPCNLPNYMGIIYRTADTLVGEDGLQCLQQYMETMDADVSSGGLLLEKEYRPTMGLITAPPRAISHLYFNDEAYFIPRTDHILDAQTQSCTTVQNASSTITSATDATTTVNQTWTYTDTTQLIEKSQMVYHGIFGKGKAHCQESMHIGIRPVNAITTNTLVDGNDNSNFTDANCEFEIECEIEINTQYPCERPLVSNGDINTNGSSLWNMYNNTDINFGTELMGGLRTYH